MSELVLGEPAVGRATEANRSERLPLLSVILFSAGTFPVSSLSVSLFVYLTPYLTGHLGVPLATVGGVWAAVRIADLFVDPLLGHTMDLTQTRLGRYRAWLVAGVPIFMLAVFMLFMAPQGASGTYVFVWLFVLYLANSILTLSQWSWAATIARDYHERSRVFGIMTATGVVATVSILLVPIAAPVLGLDSDASVRAMGWVMIVLAPLTVGVTYFCTHEDLNSNVGTQFKIRDYWEIVTKPEVIRLFFCQFALTLGPGWMAALYIFYFRSILGFTTPIASLLLLVYILSGALGAPLTSRAAKQFGKHRTLIGTTTMYSLALLGLLAVPKGNAFAVLPTMVLCGFMAAGFGLLLTAMMADVGDEIRLHQDKERMSLLYALLTFAAKLAAAGAILITLRLLDRLGFHPAEGAPNTAFALHGLQWAFLAGPVVFIMLGGACVWGWKLDADRHADVRAKLDARDKGHAI